MTHAGATPRPFLTAQWRRLAIVSYALDPALLAPLVPAGLEPDTRDSRAFVSLVAFDFLDTRVLGVRWPGLTNFPEVNLRFYVRETAVAATASAADEPRRGVCFVKELVPSRLIALVARAVYNEPYERAAMRSSVTTADGTITVGHAWRLRGGHALTVRAQAATVTPAADSAEHWFKEHEWGYGRARSGRTLVYRVEHPVWAVHPGTSADVRVDFAGLYGQRWAWLNGATPASVVLAVGSGVSVFPAGALPTT